MLKIMSMTAGDFSFDTLFRRSPSGESESATEILFPRMSYVLWIIFVILMPVLFTNMLVNIIRNIIITLWQNFASNTYINSLVPRPPVYVPFAFTIIHGSRRPFSLVFCSRALLWKQMEGKNEGGLGMRLVYESINSCKQLYIVTVFHMLLILSGCCYIYYIEKAYITHDVNSHI